MSDEIICPACGSPKHYRLKDQRLQCAECRKKYTEQTHRCRLSEETLQHMVRSFWRMVPASTSAGELEVNLKTLQKYHHLLRLAISDASESSATQRLGASNADPRLFQILAKARGVGGGAEPLFCLVKGSGKVMLLNAEHAEGNLADLPIQEIAGWIYARDRQALASLDLDRIHFLSAAEGPEPSEPAGFWVKAKKGLVKYHGGFRKNFQLFMREMEFRFNNDNEDFTCGILLDFLQNDTTNRDRR